MKRGKYCKKCPEDEQIIVKENPRTTICSICGKKIMRHDVYENK
jgi:hypothetical protein